MRYITYISRKYIDNKPMHFTPQGLNNIERHLKDKTGVFLLYHGFDFSNVHSSCEIDDLFPINLKISDDIFALQFDRRNGTFTIWYTTSVRVITDITMYKLMAYGVFNL